MTRKANISRRQFLTAAFRERDAALSETEAASALPHEPNQRALDEHSSSGWEDGSQVGRKFTARETAPQIPDWDDGIERVLEEMENLKGIEDF